MSILATILKDKGPEVAAARERKPLSVLEEEILAADTVRDFSGALARESGQAMRVIAEFKRASPSAGAIAAERMPEWTVGRYQAGGADAVSVLTDEKYFDGRLEFLGLVRQAVDLPILRKDFIVDSYQIAEARAAGADAVLLIASALQGTKLGELYDCAQHYGLHTLLEVHDEEEAARAVEVGARVIGVNHRNLATFEVDLSLSGRLAGLVPKDCILVGESGIRSAEDVARLAEDGVHAVLVGETLMRAEDPAIALRELRGEVTRSQ